MNTNSKMKIVFLIAGLIYAGISNAQVTIVPDQAPAHINENVNLKGIIYGGYAFKQPDSVNTLLIIGDTFPNNPMTLRINNENIAHFPPHPERYYFNRTINVEGVLVKFKGKPQIVLTDSSQITILFTPPSSDSNLVDTTIKHPVPPVEDVSTFGGCPPAGQTPLPNLIVLNKQKNRYISPVKSDYDTSVSINSLLKKGNDETRWSPAKAAEITAYVLNIKSGGVETCNCHATDSAHMDTHIEVILNPGNNLPNQRIIVEVTPRMRYLMSKAGVDWSTKSLKSMYMGKWVKVSGWLFFDAEHKGSSENTNPGAKSNWRASAWEIHPVTGIELINHP